MSHNNHSKLSASTALQAQQSNNQPAAKFQFNIVPRQPMSIQPAPLASTATAAAPIQPACSVPLLGASFAQQPLGRAHQQQNHGFQLFTPVRPLPIIASHPAEPTPPVPPVTSSQQMQDNSIMLHADDDAAAARDPFVPFYMRTDLKHNRTSKKRNCLQRRRRKTVEELVKDISLNGTSASNAMSLESSVSSPQSMNIVAASPQDAEMDAQVSNIIEILKKRQQEYQMQSSTPNTTQTAEFSPQPPRETSSTVGQPTPENQNFPSVNNIKYQLFKQWYVVRSATFLVVNFCFSGTINNKLLLGGIVHATSSILL